MPVFETSLVIHLVIDHVARRPEGPLPEQPDIFCRTPFLPPLTDSPSVAYISKNELSSAEAVCYGDKASWTERRHPVILSHLKTEEDVIVAI